MTDTKTIVLAAPTQASPRTEVAFVSVVLPDGREARFHIHVHLGRAGAISVELESKRIYAGKPTRTALALAAVNYSDPETGAPSRLVQALDADPTE